MACTRPPCPARARHDRIEASRLYGLLKVSHASPNKKLNCDYVDYRVWAVVCSRQASGAGSPSFPSPPIQLNVRYDRTQQIPMHGAEARMSWSTIGLTSSARRAIALITAPVGLGEHAYHNSHSRAYIHRAYHFRLSRWHHLTVRTLAAISPG